MLEEETEGKKRKVPSWLNSASKEILVKRKKESYNNDDDFSQDQPGKANPIKAVEINSKNEKNDERTPKVSVIQHQSNSNQNQLGEVSNNAINEEAVSAVVDEKIVVKNELDNLSDNDEIPDKNQVISQPLEDITIKKEVLDCGPELLNDNVASGNCSSAMQTAKPNAFENGDSSLENKVIKTEPVDDGNDNKNGGSSLANKINNTEPVNETENNARISSDVGKTNDVPVVAVAPLIVKNEPQANSSQRASCKFGITCYRQNPVHRVEEAHPGDQDYRRPEYPEPPKGTPFCPYGNLCYRRNPAHFQQFSHPPQTDPQQNYLDHKNRLRDRKPVVYMAVYPDENSSSDDDFSAGSADEFDPAGYQESNSSADEGVDVKEDDEELSDDN